jgi:1-acyl-sn-glycerol-3-phosphate acyltransferase
MGIDNFVWKRINDSFRIKSTGWDNVNEKENYVWVANHQSIIDIPILLAQIYRHTKRRPCLMLSHHFYDKLPLARNLLKAIRVEVDGSTKANYNRQQLDKTIKLLINGEDILIFPEAIILGGKYNKVIHGETGAIKLAIASQRKILPMTVVGTSRIYPFLLTTNNPLRIHKNNIIDIKVERPIDLKKFWGIDVNKYSSLNKKILNRLTDRLMRKLSKLSGLDYDPRMRRQT